MKDTPIFMNSDSLIFKWVYIVQTWQFWLKSKFKFIKKFLANFKMLVVAPWRKWEVRNHQYAQFYK
jgi:hypothetical protein